MNIYIDLVLMGLSKAIGYAFLGLIVGIIGVVLLNRFGYLKRKHVLLKFLTKLYFVVIPVAFFFYFWWAGTVNSTINVVKKSITEAIVETENEYYPQFASYINEEVKEIIHLDEIPSNAAIVDQYLLSSGIDTEKNLYKFTLSSIFKKILDVTVGQDELDREKRIANLSNGLSAKAFEYGFGAIETEMHRQVQRFLGLMLVPATITFMGILIFIIIETIISKKYLNTENESVDLTV